MLMTTQKTEDDNQKPGEKVLEKIGWEFSPNDLDKGLKAALALTQTDPTNFGQWAFAAFEVTRMIRESMPHLISPEEKDEDFDVKPTTMVEVPWWAVHALAEGWKLYLGAQTGRTIGECLKLEGGGQGKRPFKKLFDQRFERMMLALEVAFLIDQKADNGEKVSVEFAINQVADRFELSSDTVWKAWNKEKDRTKTSLKRYANLR
jgi:hypothetical protein